MVSSINTDSDSIQQMMAVTFQKLNAADTDGIRGLSKAELLSIDSTDGVGGTAFLKSLSEQFDTLDTDGNGQLSSEEIASVKPVDGPMGPPAGMDLGETDENVDAALNISKTEPPDYTAEAEDTTKTLMERILAQVLDSFADSYSKDDTDKAKEAAEAIKSADNDGTKGLSADELTSAIESGDTNLSRLAQDLKSNFGNLDKNGDGELSTSEIEKFLSGNKLSRQEMAIASEDSGSSNFSNILSNLSDSFFQKLMDSYKNGDLAKLASSLNIAV